MGYIFTEFNYELFELYININNLILNSCNHIYSIVAFILPFIVKTVIGYCHFYYQLGYGLVFYIYFFRRYRAKKNKNIKYFYGNSVLNWLLFNIVIFNKFILNRNFSVFIKTYLLSSASLIKFLVDINIVFSPATKKIYKIIFYLSKNILHQTWTPIFKRASYISFLTFLKRFVKRK